MRATTSLAGHKKRVNCVIPVLDNTRYHLATGGIDGLINLYDETYALRYTINSEAGVIYLAHACGILVAITLSGSVRTYIITSEEPVLFETLDFAGNYQES